MEITREEFDALNEKLDNVQATLNGIVMVVEAVVGQLQNHPMLKAFVQ